jgi:hypothetical protein
MAPGADRTRTRVRACLGEEDGPDKWGPPVAREGGRGEEAGCAGGLGQKSKPCGGGRKKELGWACAGEEKEKKEGQLGRAGGEEGEEKGQVGLGRKEEKREEKEKEIVGEAQLGKEGEKELHSNALNLNLKFKFKWKANNKTMQYGMECTKPIFPCISFYG